MILVIMTYTTTIGIPDDLYAWLKDYCEAHQITRNAAIINALQVSRALIEKEAGAHD
jgi:hypothetical protein